ncbi:MAG: DUF2341 domain-containing protein, partial [Bacteroidales bacterium]|nr:DUF2341 domain-containing protein [Bacteroidales bacterium]
MKRILYLSAFVIFFAQALNAQYVTNNVVGNWEDDASWNGDPAPDTDILDDDVVINGTITRNGSVDFYLGNSLYINDTLIITGDLITAIFSEIEIAPGGVLIVLGDMMGFLSFADIDGIFVVAGDVYLPWSSFNNDDGDVYLFEDTWPVTSFTQPDEVGDENDLANDYPDLADLVNQLIGDYTCSIAPESAVADYINFCNGAVSNITLSYLGGNRGTNAIARWYNTDPTTGSPVPIGEDQDLVIPAPVATTTYYVRFEGDPVACHGGGAADSVTAAVSVTVTVLPVPSAPLAGAVTQPTCDVATGSVALDNLPSSGTWTVTANPGGLALNGTGTTANFTGLTANTTYTFTVNNGSCSSPASGSVAIDEQPDVPETPAINGETSVYENIEYVYRTETGFQDYNWTVEGGTIVSGQGTDNIVVVWNTGMPASIEVEYTNAICSNTSGETGINVQAVPALCFMYRRQIDISNTVVNGSAPLYDFPFLISLNDPTLRHIYHGGNISHYKAYDILFAENADGTGMLMHQIDHYDPVTGELLVWVKIPELSNITGATLYMFYGNNSISTDLSTDAVWSNDYVAVYHMGESLRDYGPTENYGVNYGTVPQDARIGQGRRFNRSEADLINLSNEPDFRFTTTMSFSFWMYIESYPTATPVENTWMDLLIKGDNANFRLVCDRQNQRAIYAFGQGGGTSDDLVSPNNSVQAGNWYYVAGTWDGNIADPLQRKKLFINNNIHYNTAPPAFQDISMYPSNEYSVALGYNQQNVNTRSFDGLLDEVRISSGWRSNEWVLTEYNNQSAPASFIAVGVQQANYVPTAIGGNVSLAADTIQAREYTTALLSGYTGAIQWQSSTNNIDFNNVTRGGTGETLITRPLLQSAYFRAMVSDGGCSALSTIDSVIVVPGFVSCGYNNRLRITVDPNMVEGDDNLTDFPLLLNIQHDNLRYVDNDGMVTNVNGYDIEFSADDGTTLLSHEVESYNNTTGALRVWVRVPVLYASDTTVLFLYYGNPDATTDPSSSSTWSDNYIGVWHMNEAVGANAADASGNGNVGTQSNNVGTTTGRIGTARTFNGTNQYFTIANESVFDVSESDQLTVSCWIYSTNFRNTRQEQFITKGTTAGQDGWFLRENAANESRPQFFQYYSGDDIYATNSVQLTNNNWYYLTATFVPGLNSTVVYINGNAAGSVKNNPRGVRSITNNNWEVRFGSNAGATPGNYFTGYMDEVRIQNVTRTADWVITEYRNQNNPAAYIFVTESGTCISDPVAGTAATTDASVCQGESTSITLTGNVGNIYWQSSTDNINWEYLPGEFDSVLITGPLTQNMYYRASVSGCCELFSNEVLITYTGQTPPALTFDVTNVTCTGGNDGEINLTATSAAGISSFLWSTGSTSEDINTLTAGYYSVSVTDNNTCYTIDSAEVQEPASLPVPTITITETSGTTDNDGTICSGDQATLTAGGGSTYLWLEGNQTSDYINVTTSGSYTLRAYDAVGCYDETSVGISVDPLPTITGITNASGCENESVSLGATASAGTINWYNDEFAGTLQGSGTNFNTPNLTTTTSYWVDAINNGCISASRTEVIATINPLPAAAGTITGTATVCQGQNTVAYSVPAIANAT